MASPPDPNQFETVLKKEAGADSRHDFGADFQHTDSSFLIAYNDGLPSPIKTGDIKDEDDILLNCIKEHSSSKEQSSLKDFYTKIASKSAYDFTVWDGTHDLHTYRGRMINVDDANIANRTGSNICEALFPSKNSVNLIVDFFQCHFMDFLKNGTRYDKKTVHYLFTPENENDPASKTPYNDKIFSLESGVVTRSYFQSDNKPIVYGPFEKAKGKVNYDNYKSLFYSSYHYNLSPLIQVKSLFGKSVKFKTDLTITNQTGSSVNIVKNSKLENSITTILKYIRKLFSGKKMSTRTKDYDFNVASKYQQKRGGDWFQVLACLDVSNRTFQENGSGAPATFKVSDTFFVTHDRIATAYALTMGVNVVFVTPNYNYYTFTKTEYDNMSKADIVANITARREELKSQNGSFEKIRNFVEKLIQERGAKLSEIETKIRNQLTILEENVKGTRDKRENVIRDLFKAVVEYSYVLETVPDLTMHLVGMEDLVANKENDAYLDANINRLQNIFYTCNTTYKKYSPIQETLLTPKWMKQIENKDSWKAAARWTERAKMSSRMLNFITKGGVESDDGETRKQDINIFLSSTLNLPSQLKQQIVMEVSKIYIKIKGGSGGFLLNDTMKPYLFLFEEIRLLYGENYDNALGNPTNTSTLTATTLNATMDGIIQSVSSTIQMDTNANATANTFIPNYIYQEQQISLAEKQRDPDNTDYPAKTTNTNTTGTNIVSSPTVGTTQKTGGSLRKKQVQRGGADPMCVIQDIDLNETVMYHYGIHLLMNKNEIVNEAYKMMFDETSGTMKPLFTGGGPEPKQYSPGYHPLLPLHMILTACYQNIQPKLKDSPDYPFFLEYVDYLINLRNKMIALLEAGKYIDALIFGFVLRFIFFQLSNSTHIQKYGEIFNNFNPQNFRLFTMMNTMLSHSICGTTYFQMGENQMAFRFLTLDSNIKEFFNMNNTLYSPVNHNLEFLEDKIKTILNINIYIMSNYPFPKMNREQIRLSVLSSYALPKQIARTPVRGTKRMRNKPMNKSMNNMNSNVNANSNNNSASVATIAHNSFNDTNNLAFNPAKRHGYSNKTAFMNMPVRHLLAFDGGRRIRKTKRKQSKLKSKTHKMRRGNRK
jgi:hypothetical protein